MSNNKYNTKSPFKSPARKRIQKNLGKTKNDILCTQLKHTAAFNEILEEYHPSAGLFEEGNDVEGKSIFQMTPSSTKKTPKCVTVKDNTCYSKKQLSSNKAVSFKNVEETPGKYSSRFRQKMKEELASLKTENAESDPEDSEESISDEDGNISGSSSDIDAVNSVSDSSRKKKKNFVSTFAETYFYAQKETKSGTSNRTLTNVKLEQTNIEELTKLLQNIPEFHKKEKEAMYDHYHSFFEKWAFLLEEGFNILLYGVGSKQQILNDFCKEYLEDELYIVINGFFPMLNIKQILSSITEEVLEQDEKFTSVHDHVEFIKKYFSEKEKELYVVVHSIDGVALRNVKTQSVLSSLSAVPNIHFVASVDHINCSLIWDQIMLSHFKWLWCDVTTFEPYIYETSYSSSLLREKSTHLLLSSLLHVYNSLTPNGRGVFMILAKRQNEEKNSSHSGMPFHEWYQECREAFLVNSEITMQAQLSEFKNHKLLASRKSIEGAELWYIPVDTATLTQFLESCD